MTARTYIELFETPYRLRLERESARYWIIVDTANQVNGEPVVMGRHEDPRRLGQWAHAFLLNTPGASLDVDSLVDALASRNVLREEEVAAPSWDDGSTSSSRSNVLPFRKAESA